MKNGLLLFLLIFISMLLVTGAEASISISNVVCQQQYPWNGKVNIEYDVYGGSDATNIWISATGYDKIAQKIYTINSLTGDGADGTVKPGKHRMVWDSKKDCNGVNIEKFTVTLQGINSPKYMIVNLETGEIIYMGAEPSGGWSDEYKTTKMALRFIPSGTFLMGSPESELGRRDTEDQHSVTINKPFYIGVFELTQRQYETITGSNLSHYVGDMRPVDCAYYNLIRGADKGAGWPDNNDVDEASFLGKLRTKTGKAFDLPTEAQWEYACRAGTTMAWNNGTDITNTIQDAELDKLGRYFYNFTDGKGGYSDYEHTTVGSYLPNAWGLYDMHGNVCEWCLDWYGSYEGDATDPKGPSEGTYRLLRGGGYNDDAYGCRSANRYYFDISGSFFHYDFGLRVVLVP